MPRSRSGHGRFHASEAFSTRHKRRCRMSHRLGAALLGALIIAGTSAVRSQTNPLCTNPAAVMCGLDNRRGLGFDAAGALYVAEAGRGNAGADPVVLRDDANPGAALPSNCVNNGEAF